MLEVAVKSQELSVTKSPVANLDITSLYLMFCFTSIPPFSRVFADNNAADTHFPACSPA